MNYLSNHKGISLPLVLMVMVVLMLLGTALLNYSTSEALQVARAEKSIQAYYIARAGAEATAHHIIHNPGNAENLIDKTSPSKPGHSNFDNGRFEIDITGSAKPGPMIINSTGYVGNIKKVVKLELYPLTGKDVFSNSIYTYGDLYVDKMKTVTGPLQSAGHIEPPAGKYPYGIKPNSYIYFPPPTFPNNLTSKGTLDVTHDMTINESAYYDRIDVKNNKALTFDTKGTVLKIVVDILDSKGDIDVIGNGRLELYVNQLLELQTPITFNNSVGDPNDLIVYLANKSTFKIHANGVFSGFIYGPYADVELQSGQTTVKGAIVSNLVVKQKEDSKSNASVLYLPIAEYVDIQDSIIGYRKGNWN